MTKAKKASKAKAKWHRIDPKRLAAALKWYRQQPADKRSLRDAVKRYPSISFESLRKAALAGKRRRRA